MSSPSDDESRSNSEPEYSDGENNGSPDTWVAPQLMSQTMKNRMQQFNQSKEPVKCDSSSITTGFVTSLSRMSTSDTTPPPERERPETTPSPERERPDQFMMSFKDKAKMFEKTLQEQKANPFSALKLPPKDYEEAVKTDMDSNPVDPSSDKSSERTQTDKDTNQIDPSSDATLERKVEGQGNKEKQPLQGHHFSEEINWEHNQEQLIEGHSELDITPPWPIRHRAAHEWPGTCTPHAHQSSPHSLYQQRLEQQGYMGRPVLSPTDPHNLQNPPLHTMWPQYDYPQFLPPFNPQYRYITPGGIPSHHYRYETPGGILSLHYRYETPGSIPFQQYRHETPGGIPSQHYRYETPGGIPSQHYRYETPGSIPFQQYRHETPGYIPQQYRQGSQNTTLRESPLTAGQINIEINAPVNHYQEDEINPKLKQTVEDLWKILEMFKKESSKDIKPLYVAKFTGIGRSKKDVNSLLYFLKNKSILTLKTGEKGAVPRWSRHPSNTYTEQNLQEWAAELVYKSTPKLVAKDLWKILEIFNKESSKDIKTLDVAKLIGIGRSKKAVKNLLHFLKSKNILTVKTGKKGADPRWSRHPTNTYTVKNLQEWAAEIVYKSPPKLEAMTVHHHHQRQQHDTYLQVGDQNYMEWFDKLDLKCDNIDIHCIVDRRLERKYVSLYSVYKHEPYEQWFCKLDLKCDNVDIHCIVDRRLERKYASLNSVYKHEPYERISTGPISFVNLFDKKKMTIEQITVDDPLTMTVNQLNQTTQSEFEQLYTIKSTVSDRSQLDLRRVLVDASRHQFSILCRWLMANIHNRGVTNNEMESALDIAFKNLDKDTAKAISWCITKTFYKTFQVNLSHCFDVYPGLRCQCLNKGKNTNTLCSNDKLIIITAGAEVKGLPEEYKGFKIKIMNVHDKSTEKSEGETLSALLSKNYTDSYHIKVNISNTTAKKLFDSHSNLALICSGVHRSFSFARKHKVKNELCIQLYCKLKGILPLGEIHFPDSIHGIPTDVIDGEACFISKLHIGDKIGQLTSTGTLGGFVKYLGFECFLTCAHVMYDVQTLLGSSSDCAELREAKAYTHTPFGVIECGQVIWRAFDHDDRSKTSVDAALVLLQNNFTMDPNDYIQDIEGSHPFSKLGLSSAYLNLSLLDHEDFCVPKATATVVVKGAMTSLRANVTFPKQSDVEIVFSNIGQAAGIANGNEFHPLWIYTPVHMQSTEGCLTDKRVFRMYNQIAIKNLGLQPGDSGTCIYIIEHPQNNGCIGMAIAFCGDLTIVTPLKDIINRMSNMY